MHAVAPATGSRGSPATGRHKHLRPLGHVTMGALVLIGGQALLRLTIGLGSYFWQDDFIHLDRARAVGWSGSYLVRDYNDHVEVGTNLVYLLLAHGPPLTFVPAALVMCLLQLVASLLFWRVLAAVLGAQQPLVWVPLTAYLFSPLGLVSATWLAAALQALSYQIALFAVLLAMNRLHRGGGPRWAAVSLGSFVLGMTFWEKSALVLPTVAALLLVVVWHQQPWRQRMASMWQHRWVWALHIGAMAAYLAAYFTITDGSERSEVAAAPYLRAALTTVMEVFTPGILGGPWHSAGAENTLFPHSGDILVAVCLLVILLLVAWSVRLAGLSALPPWGLAAAYVCGDVALMLWGRAGYLTLVDRDPRYLADAVPVVLLCATAAFAIGFRSRPALDRAALWSASISASALLLASCLLTTFLLAPVVQRTYSRDFVRGLVETFESRPGVSVVNTDSPPAIAAIDQRGLLSAVGFDAPFDQPGTDMSMFDSLARLRPVELRDTTLSQAGPRPDCGWPVTRARTTLGELPPGPGRGYLLRLGYVSGVDARLWVEVGGQRQALDMTAGVGHAWFVVSGQEGEIAAWSRRTLLGVCVADVSAGTAWPAP
jgi:hypothetical protein